MINKVLSFLIRGGITGVLGFAVGAPLRSIEIASIIWVIGGIYTLSKFNHPFKIVVLMTDKIENKANVVIDENSKKKIESDMLRIKNLYDNGILTQDEYDQKIQILKDKYLS
jgi:uncharacterized membrane protein (Fun14 family)